MVFYLIVLLLLTLLAVLNNSVNIKYKNTYLYMAIGSIYLLMILKQPVVGDYRNYATHFLTILYKSLQTDGLLLSEPGFYALNRIIRSFTANTFYFFAITSGFICFSVGKFILKFADDKKYAIFFYYTIGLFAFSLAGMRQTLAMSICLFSFAAMKERKLIKFSIVIGLAFLFHKSAVFFFPAYFIMGVKWKFQNIFGVVSIYALICIFFTRIYEYIALWLDYDYGIESTGNGQIFLFILGIISVLAIIYRKKLLEVNPGNIMFINLHFAMLALWFFRMFTRTVERPSYYYLFASIILLDKIFSLKLEKDSELLTKKVLVLLSLFFFGIFFIYRTLRDRNLLPYILNIG